MPACLGPRALPKRMSVAMSSTVAIGGRRSLIVTKAVRQHSAPARGRRPGAEERMRWLAPGPCRGLSTGSRGSMRRKRKRRRRGCGTPSTGERPSAATAGSGRRCPARSARFRGRQCVSRVAGVSCSGRCWQWLVHWPILRPVARLGAGRPARYDADMHSARRQ